MNAIFSTDAPLIFARILGLLFAIPFHEVAHAWISDRLGDHTARFAGRLSLNPFRHLDVLGLLSMLLLGVGWAKPVPVDTRYYQNQKAGMAITAAAGPLSNLLLAFVATVLFKVLYYAGMGWALHTTGLMLPEWFQLILQVVQYFAFINISLALFNLLPVPPLDGSRIFGLLLPQKLYFAVMRYERYIMIGLIVLFFILPRITPIDPLGWLLGDAVTAVYRGVLWLTGFVDRLFSAFLF